MYITCPNCKTPFYVDGVMIDAVGRPVRCFNCQKIWHQYPVAAQPPPPQYAAPPPPPPEPEPVPAPPPEPEPAPAPEPEPEPVPEEEHPSDDELDQMLGPEEEIESVDVMATSDDDITDWFPEKPCPRGVVTDRGSARNLLRVTTRRGMLDR